MMKYIPVPEESDYGAAIALNDEQVRRAGGPWFIAHHLELRAHDAPSIYESLISTGMYARGIEPVDDNDRPLDPMSYRTHAFKHGILMGQAVVGLAHKEMIDPKRIIPALQLLTDKNSKSAYDRADTMVSIGEGGLSLIDEKARDTIDAWSDDAVSDVRARRMYTLGCGATILVANSIHQNHNDRLFELLIDTSVAPPNPEE